MNKNQLPQEFITLKRIADENDHQRKVGDNIRQLRNFLGLTQKELAEKVGCTRQSISFFENGNFSDVFKSSLMLKKIASALDTTIIELCNSEHITNK